MRINSIKVFNNKTLTIQNPKTVEKQDEISFSGKATLAAKHNKTVQKYFYNLKSKVKAKADEAKKELFKSFIKSGVDVNFRDLKNNATLLMGAAKENFADICRMLLKKGAKINAQDNHGKTALHHAVESGNLNTVRVLLSNAKYIGNVNDFNEHSAIYSAAMVDDARILKLLLQKFQADIPKVDRIGQNPLFAALAANKTMNVKLLLEYGVNPDLAMNDGTTPLFIAVYKNNLRAINMLLKRNVNVNKRNADFITPLMFAAKKSNSEVVKLLIKSGADVNAQDAKFKSPLDYAIESSSVENIKVLLEAGANPFNKKGTNPFLKAVKYNKTEIAELMLKKVVNVNQRDIKGNAALHYAVKNKNLGLAEILLKYNSLPNLKDGLGDVPLKTAIVNADSEMINLLIKYGADPDIPDFHGYTARAYARISDLDVNFSVPLSWKERYDTARELNLLKSNLVAAHGHIDD